MLLDGRDWTEAPIFPTLDNLVADGLLPPLVAVLRDSIDFATRARELPAGSPNCRPNSNGPLTRRAAGQRIMSVMAMRAADGHPLVNP